MVTEIAYIEIELADAGAFEEAVASCVPLFLAARGCRTVTLARVVENPAKYRLLVEWDTVDDHMVHFRDSAAFQTWSAPAMRKPRGAAPSDVVRPPATFVKRTLMTLPSRTAAANVGPDPITSRP